MKIWSIWSGMGNNIVLTCFEINDIILGRIFFFIWHWVTKSCLLREMRNPFYFRQILLGILHAFFESYGLYLNNSTWWIFGYIPQCEFLGLSCTPERKNCMLKCARFVMCINPGISPIAKSTLSSIYYEKKRDESVIATPPLQCFDADVNYSLMRFEWAKMWTIAEWKK